jgi:sulfhydrogenase subunit alpha
MDGKKVTNVQFNVLEGPRLIETLTVGKTPQEDISLVCRICAICTLSHRYAAIRALERALGIQVPEKTQLTRTLMPGEMVESHSCTYSSPPPDPLNKPSTITLDQFGEVVWRPHQRSWATPASTVSDRMIHENPTMGGFGRFPAKEQLLDIKKETEELIPFGMKTIELLSTFTLPSFFESDTLYVALDPEDGKFGLVADRLILSNGEKKSIEDYKSLTNERVVKHSFAKHSLYNGKPFSVGALARVNLLGERLEGRGGQVLQEGPQPCWKKNPPSRIMAQAVEMLFALEQIPPLVDKIIALKDRNCKARQRPRRGRRGRGAQRDPVPPLPP